MEMEEETHRANLEESLKCPNIAIESLSLCHWIGVMDFERGHLGFTYGLLTLIEKGSRGQSDEEGWYTPPPRLATCF